MAIYFLFVIYYLLFQYTGCPEKEVPLEITLLLLNVDYYASGDLNELST